MTIPVSLGCVDYAGKTDTIGAEAKVMVIEAGRYGNNCYVVRAVNSREAVVIDPGFEHNRIKKRIAAKGLVVKAIVLSHGHEDHTRESHLLQESTGAMVYIHPEQRRFTSKERPFDIDREFVREVEDGDDIEAGPLSLRVIHTPGHSQGGICLYIKGALFTGDLLFKGNVGRTDMSGGSRRALKKSLAERLAHVPDATKVFPGHGESTTMGQERKTNPFLRQI